MGYGIIFDCYRIITISFIGFVPEYFDRFNYIIKVAFVFFSVPFTVQTILILSKQSGHEVKNINLIHGIMLSYIFTAAFVSVLNMFYLNKTNINELGFYTYQINATLYFICVFFALPLMLYTAYLTFGVFIKDIKNKKLQFRLTLFMLIYIPLIIERLNNLGLFAIIPNTAEATMLGLSLLTLIMDFAFLFSIIYPNFLESLSAYFSIRSIYLIKNTGELIYEHNFQEGLSLDPMSPRKILLSGFMFGITKGLEEILSLKKSDYTMNFGDLTLLFQHGKQVFGLIFASEVTPIMVEKLIKFIKIFEENFLNRLEKWTGRMEDFEKNKIQRWITEIFR